MCARRLLPPIFALLFALPLFAQGPLPQEPPEARAARLQPQEIPELTRKAEAGDFASQKLLWLAYSHGYGVPKEPAKAVPWLRKLAEAGDPRAQFTLADWYHNELGGLRDEAGTQAFQWMLRAAQNGHLVAQHNVGSMYFHGGAVAPDLQQAMLWYGRAAERGFAHSQWSLGRIYAEGLGIVPNRAEAERWLTKAVAQGHPGAMEELAWLYTGADGVPLQPQLVFDLHRAAAEKGLYDAEYRLGVFYRAGYLGAPDYAQAHVWLRRAAADGYAPADLVLGFMFERGQGVPADFKQALSHYERAAGAGVSEAIQTLGVIYRDGRGVPADPVAALKWFLIGSRMRISESQNALQAMVPQLSEDRRNMAAALVNTWINEHPDALRQEPGKFQLAQSIRVPGPQVPHPPSTPDERAYAIDLTRRLEQDPLSLNATAARAWLQQWWKEIPDVTVRPCNLIDSPDHQPYQYENELYDQITYSEGAFILENLGKPVDWDAAFLAAVNGALRAYEAILRQKPLETSRALDALLERRNKNQLAGTVSDLVKERCK